jgi:hypothetical protein
MAAAISTELPVVSRGNGIVNDLIATRSIESPEQHMQLLERDTLEDPTVGVRESPAFAVWRGLVADCFARPPFVEHFVLRGSGGSLDRVQP